MKLPLYAALDTISVYQGITRLPLFRHAAALLRIIEQEAPDHAALFGHYTGLYHSLAAQGYASFGAWLHDQLRYSDSPYGQMAADGTAFGSLAEAAKQEVEIFARMAALHCKELKNRMAARLAAPYDQAALTLPEWDTEVPFDFPSLTGFYLRSGCGMFARYRAFLWEHETLTPIPHPDTPEEDEMVGYRLQRNQVEENTRALLDGHLVNNVLLYGDAGTGKSATIKSLLSVPSFHHLRLIEVQKEHLGTIPLLLRRLRGQKQKFILFLDDISFENGDKTLPVLKTILEGGLEPRPNNTAIYATSNRRHLVRAFFSERGREDEISAEETVQEKASLAERFGVRIPYLSLNQADFFSLVEDLALKTGLTLSKDALRKLAHQWEMAHPGRTPRAARQFIGHLSAQEHPASDIEP